MRNLKNYHTADLGQKIGKGMKRGIKGAAKIGVRTAFRASTGSLAAAVALASGSGMDGAIAAYAAGANAGNRLADGAIGLGGKVAGLPGVVRKERDIYHGNNEKEEEHRLKELMSDENNRQYIRDKLTKENGYIPSNKEVTNKMKDYKDFFQSGMTDMDDVTKAYDIAQERGISNEQYAKILAVGRERKINASVLNKEADRKVAQRNLQAEFEKNHSQKEAKQLTEHVIDNLDAFYGVAGTSNSTNTSTGNSNSAGGRGTTSGKKSSGKRGGSKGKGRKKK